MERDEDSNHYDCEKDYYPQSDSDDDKKHPSEEARVCCFDQVPDEIIVLILKHYIFLVISDPIDTVKAISELRKPFFINMKFNNILSFIANDGVILKAISPYINEMIEAREYVTGNNHLVVEELARAICESDLQRARWLMLGGVNVNDTLEEGTTVLIKAVRCYKHVEILRWLLQKGANIDASDDAGNTALMIAVVMGSKDIVKFLLDQKANIGIRNNGGLKARKIAKLNRCVDESDTCYCDIEEILIEEQIRRNKIKMRQNEIESKTRIPQTDIKIREIIKQGNEHWRFIEQEYAQELVDTDFADLTISLVKEKKRFLELKERFELLEDAHDLAEEESRKTKIEPAKDKWCSLS